MIHETSKPKLKKARPTTFEDTAKRTLILKDSKGSSTLTPRPVLNKNLLASETPGDLQKVLMAVDKLDMSLCRYVSIDAEWYQLDKTRTSLFLTKQFTFFDGGKQAVCTVALWDERYPLPTIHPDLGHDLFVIPCDVQDTGLADVCDLPKKLDVLMYSSPKDVEGMIGRKAWREILLDPKSPISKKRNLTGTFTYRGTEYTLKDLFGTFGTSLEKALISVGVNNPYKTLADKGNRSKGRMDLFMVEDPNEFLMYAVGDTIFLMDVLQRRVEQVNDIIQGAHPSVGIAPYTYDDFPMSSGSLVAKTYERWLIAKYPKLMRAVLTISDSNNNRSWNDLKKYRKGLEEETITLEDANRVLRTDKFVHGMGMCSITNFVLLEGIDSTALFGSVVQGGRCINEDRHDNPYENRIENVVDIDLSSCYGSALRKFDYPFGIPYRYGRRVDDDIPKKLGEYLKANEKELIVGLFAITVSGNLSFQQDLMHSKYGLTTQSIVKKLVIGSEELETDADVWGREIESAHIGGKFALTMKQIENGIITSQTLAIIKKVSTSKEFKEWMNLDVIAAVYYKKSDRLSLDEWTELMQTQNGRGRKTQAMGDERSTKWCSVLLEEFIGAFVDYRDILKAEMKEEGKNTERGTYLNLLQTGVKLFINTMYGCLASPYFPMGNTVLANNITSQARAGTWMMSKALGCVQSITDGGMFDYKKVFTLTESHEGRRPGFQVLANRERMNSHRSLKRTPLTLKDVWTMMKNRTKNDEKELDTLCTEHINKFWKNYGLELPFSIECKYENTGKEAVYYGSADYLIYETVGDETYDTDEDDIPYLLKCRGAKDKDHPKKLWLWHLLNSEKYANPNSYFEGEELYQVNEFKKNPHDELMPGDGKLFDTLHHPHAHAGRLYDTYEELKQGEDRASKEKRRGVNERVLNPDIRLGLARLIYNGKLKPPSR